MDRRAWWATVHGVTQSETTKRLTLWFHLATPYGGMWDLSSCPGVEPTPPGVKVRSLNHWTTMEIPVSV